MSIGLFYGSTTSNTEAAAERIKEEFGDHISHCADILHSEPNELLRFDALILGISTWNIGELQDDWEDFLPKMTHLNLTGKKIALFGLGDSHIYADTFLDAMGLLWNELKNLGSRDLIGIYPSEGYTFTKSKGMYDDRHFLGLGLDEENESELHEIRIKSWTEILKRDLGIAAL